MAISSRAKKFLCRTFLVTFILGVLGYLFIAVYCPWQHYGHKYLITQSTLEQLVTASLRIPYAGLVDKAFYKDSLEDLEEITYDEWMNMECECRDRVYDFLFDEHNLEVLPKSARIEANKLNSKQRQHLYCLRPDHWQAFGGGGFINKMPKNLFGLNIFTERGLHLTMNEYVLKYPKVLSNVIKILEKPCFYFKDLPLPPDSEPLIYSDVEETEHFLKHEKSALYCNRDRAMYYEKERTYSVLRLVDSKGRSKVAIVIPRKDNAPSVKK
jgi:hypothetical protein